MKKIRNCQKNLVSFKIQSEIFRNNKNENEKGFERIREEIVGNKNETYKDISTKIDNAKLK